MNSLLKHVADLDRWESNHKTLVKSLAAAIESVAQFAVVVDAKLTEEHQAELRKIHARVMQAADPDALAAVQPTLQLEVLEYRDRCGAHLKGIQHEFSSTLLTLHQVLSSFSSSGANQEMNLKGELSTLAELAEGADPDVLRRGVRGAVKTITECVAQMKRENEVIVAQFKDEIRTMQTRVEAAEAGAAVDSATGALTRVEFEARVRKDVSREAPVCLLVVSINNLKELQIRRGNGLVAAAVALLCGRVREQFGNQMDLGKWSDRVVMVKLSCAN